MNVVSEDEFTPLRHVFILNPAAGKEKKALSLRAAIMDWFDQHGGEYVIYETDSPGDATELVRREQAARSGTLRFYAVGGDGTLAEVLDGVTDHSRVQLASIPCGSANDLVRMMPESERYLSLPDMIEGEVRRVDALRLADGHLALNICSIGLDADVAYGMADFKHWPLVTGSMAYVLSLIRTFFRPMGHEMTVEMETGEGTVTVSGRFLFALAANGRFYGGGWKGAPDARIDDGILDFWLIDKVSRLKMLTILKKYRKGEHGDLPMCHHFRGTRMKVKTKNEAVVNRDGECVKASAIEFSVVPGLIAMVIPKGARLPGEGEE